MSHTRMKVWFGEGNPAPIIGSVVVPDLPEYYERQLNPLAAGSLEASPSLANHLDLYEVVDGQLKMKEV